MNNEKILFFLADIFFRDGAVDKEALQIASGLKKDLELWLVVDSSKEEFGSIPDAEGLAGFFHRTVCLGDFGYAYGTPEAYGFLLGEANIPKEQCLFLDTNLKRAVHAVENRIYAAVIIDNACLEREFLLRRLTDQSYVMHKKPG